LSDSDFRHSLLPAPGTYILWLQLDKTKRVRVGRLGVFTFEPGHYAYVGSAFGPGGIGARLGRHLRRNKKKRWHIDYLSGASRPGGAWICYGDPPLEHRWARALSALRGAWLPAAGFGASDCQCPAHLIGFPKPPPCRVFLEETDAMNRPVVRLGEICG
jgi:Uri superfamily endonuclease